MRTTIRLDESLLKEAKLQAARKGITLTAVIENALRESLLRQIKPTQRIPVRLVTFNGNGLLPGVDLDDTASLLDLMEASGDPD
jgi:antitoxin component of RelBE/YafQ-DinJ toxin-antitoxin module